MAVDSSANERNGSAFAYVPKEFDNVRLVLPDSELPAGKLTVTQSDLTWTPGSDDHQPWTKRFLDISLHAISTDESSGYPPCIYAQFGDNCDEFRLIPVDESRLRELYEALCEGAEKNVEEELEAGIGTLFGQSSGHGGWGGAEGLLNRMLQVPPEAEGWADDAEGENGTERDAEKSG